MFSLMHSTSALPADASPFLRQDYERLSHVESLHLYCDWLKSRGFSDTTIKSYKSWVKRFISTCCRFDDLPYGLTRELQMHELVLRFKEQLVADAQHCPQSTNNFISAIESYCRFFKLKIPEIKREAKANNSYPVLSREDLEAVMDVLRPPTTATRDQAMLLVFLHLGLSLKHCRELDLTDLTQDERTTHLNLQYGPARQRQIARVHSSSSLFKALSQWCGERPETVHEPALFLSNGGQRLSVSSIDIIVRKAGWKARVPLSIKLLRDTGSYFRRLGINLDD